MSYLGNLTWHLATSAMRIPKAIRQRHASFLLAAQADDGGFSGREGDGDLYYTGFGLRGLALVGQLTKPVARRAAEFLRSKWDTPMPSVDFLSLVSSALMVESIAEIDVLDTGTGDHRQKIDDTLESFRRDDGGYAKTCASATSSTYLTFLAIVTRQLVGLEPDRPERTLELIRSRRREDGGFVELPPIRHSGTNPTAAAVGLLRALDAVDPATRSATVEFLVSMWNAEGGFRANSRIPIADLLSTFTGLVALADLKTLDSIDRVAAGRFVEALAETDGGFRGGVWDETADVEYTFYGLGTLALLAANGP